MGKASRSRDQVRSLEGINDVLDAEKSRLADESREKSNAIADLERKLIAQTEEGESGKHQRGEKRNVSGDRRVEENVGGENRKTKSRYAEIVQVGQEIQGARNLVERGDGEERRNERSLEKDYGRGKKSLERLRRLLFQAG